MSRMREVRRGAQRAVTVHDGCEARHGFAFGAHYDPANTFFGALLAHNDERLAPGAGYATHRHTEVDLVTWVVSGALRHTDSLGHAHVLGPGEVQVLAAGTGVEHAEFCAGPEPVRFVQAWLVPDAVDPPALHRHDILAGPATGPATEPAVGEPRMIATGEPRPSATGEPRPSATEWPGTVTTDTFAVRAPLQPQDEHAVPATSPAPVQALQRSTPPLPLRRADATLHAARLRPHARWTLPDARFRHAYLTRGSVLATGDELADGDELRLTDAPAEELRAGAAGAEILVWAMGSDLRP